MSIDLEPCPFCGSEAEFVRDSDEDGDFTAVGCTGCGCGSGKHYPIMDSADANAANEWNTRVPSAAARERDGLREALPDLKAVIGWLQMGCDPVHAITELAIYQGRIDCARQALTQETQS